MSGSLVAQFQFPCGSWFRNSLVVNVSIPIYQTGLHCVQVTEHEWELQAASPGRDWDEVKPVFAEGRRLAVAALQMFPLQAPAHQPNCPLNIF